MDIVLIQIRQCYTEMDKFWVDEVQRVTKSLKNRRVDPEDIDRWRDFRESLEHSIAHWEVWISLHHGLSTFSSICCREVPQTMKSHRARNLGFL